MCKLEVSELIWGDPIQGMAIGNTYEAVVMRGVTGYRIYDHIAGRARFKLYFATQKLKGFPTLEKAKEAAQIDFRSRIMDHIR